MNICQDVERYLLNFLTPEDYVRFTSVCKRYHDMRWKFNHHNKVGLHTVHVLQAVFDDHRNVLMHGAAGTSKSVTLHRLYQEAIKRQVYVIMTGTTGVSSCDLPCGTTIHSFSGLQKGTISMDALQQMFTETPDKQRKKFAQWKNVQLLIIDEISMLGSRFFKLLDYVAKIIRDDDRPFGGIQVVFSGDFLQLPPVGDTFAFKSQEWDALNLQPVVFTANYRQQHDINYGGLLRRIRLGMHTENDISMLRCRERETLPDVFKKSHFVPPILFSRHKDVDKVNSERIQALEGKLIEFKAQDQLVQLIRIRDERTNKMTVSFIPYTGRDVSLHKLDASFLSRVEHRQPTVLQIKHNGQYILTQNYKTQFRLVNGSIGLAEIDLGSDVSETKNMGPWNLDTLADSICMYFPKATGPFSKTKIGSFRLQQKYRIKNDIYLVRKQLTLRLGYAVTIHSSQGMTLDHAAMDIGRSIFTSAQAYVALSRVRRAEDLYLLQFDPKSLKVNQEALQYVAKIEGVEIPAASSTKLTQKPRMRRRPTTVIEPLQITLHQENSEEKKGEEVLIKTKDKKGTKRKRS